MTDRKLHYFHFLELICLSNPCPPKTFDKSFLLNFSAAAEAIDCSKTCISDGNTIIDSIDGDCLRVCLAQLEATGNCLVEDLYGDDPINVGIDYPIGDVDFWPNGGSM